MVKILLIIYLVSGFPKKKKSSRGVFGVGVLIKLIHWTKASYNDKQKKTKVKNEHVDLLLICLLPWGIYVVNLNIPICLLLRFLNRILHI